MTFPLYQWPRAAHFGRVIPKTKLYEHANVSPAVRHRFVADVQRVTWQYKLAEDTIHLRGGDAVTEIEVFRIEIKGEDVGNDVLAAIDRAVPHPIIFEIMRSVTPGEAGVGTPSVRMVAAHKQIGAGKARVSAYFSADWRPADASRSSLPPAIDLATMYTALLAPLLPLQIRPGEALSDATGRIERAHALDREIASLERNIRTETQFNRQVELRRKLKDRLAMRDELTDAAPSADLKTRPLPAKDTPWTS